MTSNENSGKDYLEKSREIISVAFNKNKVKISEEQPFSYFILEQQLKNLNLSEDDFPLEKRSELEEALLKPLAFFIGEEAAKDVITEMRKY